MRTVRHLLEGKAPEVFAIGPDAPVIDAVRLMAEKGIGALLVMQEGRLAGILSERDYARKVVLQGRASSTTPVRDIMTSQVISVGLDDTAEHCMQVVTERRIRHLPVLDRDAVRVRRDVDDAEAGTDHAGGRDKRRERRRKGRRGQPGRDDEETEQHRPAAAVARREPAGAGQQDGRAERHAEDHEPELAAVEPEAMLDRGQPRDPRPVDRPERDERDGDRNMRVSK